MNCLQKKFLHGIKRKNYKICLKILQLIRLNLINFRIVLMHKFLVVWNLKILMIVIKKLIFKINYLN